MSDIANKVETLMEAMPYLQKYQGTVSYTHLRRR